MLHQPDNVAHAQNAIRHATGDEGAELIQLFPLTGKFDGLARYGTHGKSRAPAGIAVQLGQDDARHVHGTVKGLGHIHGLLSRGGIRHQERFPRRKEGVQLAQLVYQGFIHLLTSRRVKNHDGSVLGPGPFQSLARHGHHVPAAWCGLINGHSYLFRQRRQLVHGGGTHQVAGHQQGAAPLVLQAEGQLRAGRGLAGAVQPHHHDSGRVRQIQPHGVPAQQGGDFITENFDDLLSGLDGFEHFLPHRPFLHAADEFPGHAKLHVRLQQSQPDVAQGVCNIFLGNFAQAAQPPERVIQFIC